MASSRYCGSFQPYPGLDPISWGPHKQGVARPGQARHRNTAGRAQMKKIKSITQQRQEGPVRNGKNLFSFMIANAYEAVHWAMYVPVPNLAKLTSIFLGFLGLILVFMLSYGPNGQDWYNKIGPTSISTKKCQSKFASGFQLYFVFNANFVIFGFQYRIDH